jgi:hypothetical protein
MYAVFAAELHADFDGVERMTGDCFHQACTAAGNQVRR